MRLPKRLGFDGEDGDLRFYVAIRVVLVAAVVAGLLSQGDCQAALAGARPDGGAVQEGAHD
jgi:hypothetical protein